MSLIDGPCDNFWERLQALPYMHLMNDDLRNEIVCTKHCERALPLPCIATPVLVRRVSNFVLQGRPCWAPFLHPNIGDMIK
jgi:hypothetical protein